MISAHEIQTSTSIESTGQEMYVNYCIYKPYLNK